MDLCVAAQSTRRQRLRSIAHVDKAIAALPLISPQPAAGCAAWRQLHSCTGAPLLAVLRCLLRMTRLFQVAIFLPTPEAPCSPAAAAQAAATV